MKIQYFIVLLFFWWCNSGYGQQIQKQTTEGVLLVPDSLRSIIPIKKQGLLKDTDIIFHTRFGLDSYSNKAKHTLTNFKGSQLRIEFKGKIHEKIHFRFRERFTQEPIPGNLDNISTAVDIAFLKIDVTPRTHLTVGKLFADWGGYEFDFNPLDIMQYNDILQNSDAFLVGAGIGHTNANKQHYFSFQLLNSRTRIFEEIYGQYIPPGIQPVANPLAFVGNWRGSMFKGKWQTTYSYSFFNEASAAAKMHYFVLGNKLQWNKFLLYYDFHYSREGLDRKGIISRIIIPKYKYAATDVRYIENWVRGEYLVTPKLSFILTLMNSNHRWNDNPDPEGNQLLSRSFGYIPTVEYLPFKNLNLRFFACFVGRTFNYTSYAKTTFGVKDYSTGQFSIGVVAPINVL